MKRLFAVVAVIALFSGSVLGQAPAPRPTFDIAGIQVSTRPQPGMRGGQLRGTRYEIRNATMVDLSRTAYNVQPEKIKWHMEDRPMPAFAIVADGPKMTKGDPTNRTRCFEGLPPGSPAAAKPPQFPRLVTCENVSMQQFGQLLPSIAGGYTRVNALDKTGLQGGFDFTLNFSPIQQVQGPRPEAGAANTGVALDPTGALSLQDAVRRQLGIRLEDTKLPVPVLVIDSISETPLDN